MPDINKDIERLRTAVEQKFGRKVRTPKDFEVLRDAVFQTCHEMVSVSTLKRIWGYVQTDSSPRISSLTPLAQYVGYADWEHFAEDRPGETAEAEETPDSQTHRSFARRLGIAAATVAVVAVATWGIFMGGGKEHSSRRRDGCCRRAVGRAVGQAHTA